MNSDIRISVNFVQHPKTKKTIRKYGHAAIVSIIALWGFAAQRRPEGNLTGMDADEIAIAACWDGDEQEFFDMCVEMKWIDVHEDGEIHLHGWKEAQGYVINAPARAERSRRAAQARWEKREKKELEQISGDNAACNANGMLDACLTHANGMPGAMLNCESCNAPFPAPSPSPSPSHYGVDVFDVAAEPAATCCPPCPHEQILSAYHEFLPELPSVKVWDGARKSHLQARWRERWKAGKYTTQSEGLAYWKKLFKHVQTCDWLMGRISGRDGRAFKANLSWLVRPENFAKIIEGRYDRQEVNA